MMTGEKYSRPTSIGAGQIQCGWQNSQWISRSLGKNNWSISKYNEQTEKISWLCRGAPCSIRCISPMFALQDTQLAQ